MAESRTSPRGNTLDNRPVHVDVKIEDITDPDTNTDVTPVKSGMTFMRHWVFACKKNIQQAVLNTIRTDNMLKGARWGNESGLLTDAYLTLFKPILIV